ncbi:MAG: TIGR02453 family protein [Nitratireductor sp.]|nr:TIGR02453 family protein [Nitratireductor sp.]
MADAVSFSGFGKESLPFLKALGFYQDRDWFHENRPIYLREVREPMGDLIESLSARFEKAKIPLRGDRKNSLYRVNRDVRFSKNKDPYVTHASAMLTRSGTKKDNGFVYMHYSNERSFIACGFYGLEGDAMRAFRELILREERKFAAIVKGLEKHGYRLEDESALKRNPRGFEEVSGEPLSTWIRLKNHTFMEVLTPEIFQSGEVAERMFAMGKRAMALLDFGWWAIDSVRDD